MNSILIVEDDAISQTILRATLQDYDLTMVGSYDDAVKALESGQFALSVIDLILPEGKSGHDLVTLIRSRKVHKNMQILISSVRDSVEAITTGLRLGADDFVTKPFNKLEMLARVEVCLRRAQAAPLSYIVGPVEFDFAARKAFLYRGLEKRTLDLAFREMQILELLMSNEGALVRFEELRSRLGDGYSNRELSNVISRLRGKIDSFGGVASIKNEGYLFQLKHSEAEAS